MKFKMFTKIGWAFALICALATASYAQDSCTIRLRLYDAFGDGWDGSTLNIRLGNNPVRTFIHGGTVINFADTVRTQIVRVRAGDSIIISFTGAGIFQNEIRFDIFDRNDYRIFGAGPSPTSGPTLYRGVVSCAIVCPLPTGPFVGRVTGSTADIGWDVPTSSTPTGYNVIYGPRGFTPRGAGSTTVVVPFDNFTTLGGLAELTTYEYYVQSRCASATDTSSLVGPTAFTTFRLNDMSAVGIVLPPSRCSMNSVDSVRVIIRNIGSDPQTLVPYFYSVNGVRAAVSQPIDGFYTGVLSRDSVRTLAFKATYGFSQPGDYVVRAWTAVPTDTYRANDTATVTLTVPRVVPSLPYFQNFDGPEGKDTWGIDLESNLATWQFGTPNNLIRGAASGNNAWTTARDSGYSLGEFSYLNTPCFNFTNVTTLPRIYFHFNNSTATGSGWRLEGSTDGGTTWNKVGQRNTGINWYNDTVAVAGVGGPLRSGSTNGAWLYAQNTLDSVYLNKPSCRFRFVFRGATAPGTTFDGTAIDNFGIANTIIADAAMSSAVRFTAGECGSVVDSVNVIFTNAGTVPIDTVTLFYSFNNGPVTQVGIRYATPIQPRANSATYRFRTAFNSSTIGNNVLKTWVRFANDAQVNNDTLSTTFYTPPPMTAPNVFNFNDGLLPRFWTSSRAQSIFSGAHGFPAGNDRILYYNIYGGTTVNNFTLTANRWGAIKAGDSLSYDYRIVNEASPFDAYIMNNQDTVFVEVNTTCDANFTLLAKIDSTNHVRSTNLVTKKISLAPYIGQNIRVRFRLKSAITAFIGYFFDLDNVNYIGCPVSFNPTATITKTVFNGATGAITLSGLSGGLAPYTINWNGPNNYTGSGATITGLRAGTYTANIRDNKGCTEIRTFLVEPNVGVFEEGSAIARVSLAPNPTSGITMLNVEYSKTVDANVTLMNMVGQVLYQTASRQTNGEQYTLDLNNYPAGVYLVRITADNKTHVAKLVKQ